METDPIANRNPALFHHRERSDSPACSDKPRQKIRQQGNGIPFNRQRRQTIGKDDREIARGRLKLRNRVGMERPAKNRLAQIRCTIRGVSPKLQDWNRRFSEDGQFGVKALRKRRKVQPGMDRVARLSVRELEVEHLTRNDALASRA
jgi:hypothetical protein